MSLQQKGHLCPTRFPETPTQVSSTVKYKNEHGKYLTTNVHLLRAIVKQMSL